MQTVIRRFGGKQGLLAVAARREAERVRRQQDQAPVGDLPGTIRTSVSIKGRRPAVKLQRKAGLSRRATSAASAA